MGNHSLRDIEAGAAPESEIGFVRAGRLLGMISTVLQGAALVVLGIVFGMEAGRLNARDADMTRQWESAFGHFATMNSSETMRRDILAAAVAERQRHPKKDYAALAAELNKSKGKKVAWYHRALVPPDGCGAFTFEAKGGALWVTDQCGSSSHTAGRPSKVVGALIAEALNRAIKDVARAFPVRSEPKP